MCVLGNFQFGGQEKEKKKASVEAMSEKKQISPTLNFALIFYINKKTL